MSSGSQSHDPACQRVSDLLSDYLDDDLASPARWEVKLHLDGCVHCARLLAELSATVSALHRFRDGPRWASRIPARPPWKGPYLPG